MNNRFGKKVFEKITVVLKKQLKGLIDKYEDQEAEKIMKTLIENQ